MRYDIFFYEAYEEEAPAIQKLLPSSIRAGYTTRTLQDEPASDPPAALISIRTQSIVPDGWIPQARGILARTTGYDHLQALRKKHPDLKLGCLPEYCSRAVAEHAALIWLALLRRLPRQLAQFGRFNRDGLSGGECAGRTLVVFGVGQIGHEICRIGAGLDMNVLGVDIVQRRNDVKYTTPEDGLQRADVIVCAMNLTPENIGYFNGARFNGVKRGAIFINISRGELSPATDVRRALDENILSGAGLDVFNQESAFASGLRTGLMPDTPEMRAARDLMGRENVILTPHNAFNSHEALARKTSETVQQAVHFLRTGLFLHPLPV